MAKYAFAQEQPSQEVMRDNDAWGKWCEANRERLMPEWYRQCVRPGLNSAPGGA